MLWATDYVIPIGFFSCVLCVLCRVSCCVLCRVVCSGCD
jgi:hypothetical protein